MKLLQPLAAVSALLLASVACADGGVPPKSQSDAAKSPKTPASVNCKDIYSPTVGQPLRWLQDEVLTLRNADGGIIAAEHVAYLQAKLAEINQEKCR